MSSRRRRSSPSGAKPHPPMSRLKSGRHRQEGQTKLNSATVATVGQSMITLILNAHRYLETVERQKNAKVKEEKPDNPERLKFVLLGILATYGHHRTQRRNYGQIPTNACSNYYKTTALFSRPLPAENNKYFSEIKSVGARRHSAFWLISVIG